jgi:hypothetical protein
MEDSRPRSQLNSVRNAATILGMCLCDGREVCMAICGYVGDLVYEMGFLPWFQPTTL